MNLLKEKKILIMKWSLEMGGKKTKTVIVNIIKVRLKKI